MKGRARRVSTMERLRADGWTWERIGRRYSITRQAASQYVKRYRTERPRE